MSVRFKIGMSYRFMRMIVMFDLPTDTSADRRHYRQFRKFLLNDGFVMMQESIYTKICINAHTVERLETKIDAHKPPKGLVQILTVTEKQFVNMKFVVGVLQNNYIQSDERLVVL